MINTNLASQKNMFVKQVLSRYLRYANVVSLHSAFNRRNIFIYAGECIFSMPLERQPYFLTACRGKVTDTAALVECIEK